MQIPRSMLSVAALLALLTTIPSTQMPKVKRPADLRPSPSLVPPAAATLATFEEPQSVENWFGLGTTKVQRSATGGLPGAFLSITGFVGRDPCGAFTRRPESTGAYSRAGTIAFDIKLAVQQINDYKVRVLLQHSPSVIYWYHDITVAADSAWHHVSIPVEPT